jgi:hypothetical protein
MGVYGAQVMDSTKERGTEGVVKNLRNASQRMRQAQEQWGSRGRATTGMDPRDQAEALRDYGISEADRRQQASSTASQFGQGVDQRKAEVSNATQKLIDTQEASVRGAEQSQRNLYRENDLSNQMANNDINEKLKQVDWGSYQNQTSRQDAFTDMFRQGKESDYFLDKAINQQVKMQDLDMWYKTLSNQIDNDFKDWEFKTKAQQDAILTKYQQQGQNIANTVSGLTAIANYGIQYAMKKEGGLRDE